MLTPELLIMDAMQVFVQGGPESGRTADPGIAASRDRVASTRSGWQFSGLWAWCSLNKGILFRTGTDPPRG